MNQVEFLQLIVDYCLMELILYKETYRCKSIWLDFGLHHVHIAQEKYTFSVEAIYWWWNSWIDWTTPSCSQRRCSIEKILHLRRIFSPKEISFELNTKGLQIIFKERRTEGSCEFMKSRDKKYSQSKLKRWISGFAQWLVAEEQCNGSSWYLCSVTTSIEVFFPCNFVIPILAGWTIFHRSFTGHPSLAPMLPRGTSTNRAFVFAHRTTLT